MATIYGSVAIAGPLPLADPGDGTTSLYHYWLRLRNRPGRNRRVEVTPPVSRYEQVARQLRERIFSGEYPPDSKIPSGWTPGRYPVSQPVVQRACTVLVAEGLVSMEAGRGTTVLSRQRWLVSFESRLPLDEEAREAALAAVRPALSQAAGEQPAVSGDETQRSAIGLLLTMTVESAELGGAVTAALPVAKQALGPLPIVAQSAREA